MRYTRTEIEGPVIIDLERHADERGWFARAWAVEEMAAEGLETRLVHCNLAYNARRGTVRGMHWQDAPHEEVKLVRATRGAVYDVIVDLRPGSPTRGGGSAWSSRPPTAGCSTFPRGSPTATRRSRTTPRRTT